MKLKKICIKICKILLSLLMIFSVIHFSGNDVNALSNISQATGSTVFDSEYGFSYKFISGVTTIQSFGCQNNYDQDDWSTNDSHGFRAEGWEMATVTSNSQKGNIGCWYRNVGQYFGKTVDLKITVTDWDAIRTVNTSFNGKSNYATVCFDRNSIRLSLTTKCFQNIKTKYEFYEHGTNNKISIKCHENLYDIDNGETAYLSNSSIKNAYLYQTTELDVSGSTVSCRTGINSSNDDIKHWVTLLVDGSEFELTYNRMQDDINSTSKSRTFYNFGFNGESVAPFNTPTLSKQVSKTLISSHEGFSYSFATNIPQQPTGKEYTSFSISDTLDNSLQLSNNNLTVYNDSGQNVSSNFSLSQSGQKITISAGSYVNNSNFYNKSYTFSFNVVPKSNYSFSPSNGKVNIANSASVSTNYGTKTSNTVNTEVRFKIDTQATNSSITQSMTNIIGGTNKTVSWTANDGYWISSVQVDGVAQSISSYRGGNYTFSNINKDHDVKVVANPCYNITTEVVNGSITGSQTKIDPNENRTISFSPDDHYYVSEVIVDGHAYSYKDYASAYTFSKINANHHIKVVCEPLKTITTEVVNGIITKTMTDVHPDESKDVLYYAFSDYYIDKVTVDGKAITVDDFISGNYEFDPVVTDHSVKVVCSPKPIIRTEIVNGDITPEFNVYPHEDGYVHFRADENYYINRVLIDSKEYNSFEEYEDKYGFFDITADHDVYVECVPMPVISVKKATDKEVYNYKDTILYSLDVTQTVQNTSAYNVKITDKDMTKGVEADLNSVHVSGTSDDNYTVVKTVNGFEILIKQLNYSENVHVEFDANVADKDLVNKSISNTVYATADHFNSQIKDTVTNKILKPKLNIEKTSDKSFYNTREDIEYSIKATQTVENAKAFNAKITDSGLDKGVVIDMDSITVSGVDEEKYSLNKKENSFDLVIDEMTDSQDIYITYHAKIDDDSLAGKKVTNKATITSLTNDEIVEDTLNVNVLKPQLVISKTADKDYYNVGENAIFTITTTQTIKNAIAYDTLITDKNVTDGVDIDMNSIAVSGIDKNQYEITKNDNSFSIKIAQLSNETVTITYQAKIKANDLAGKEISNTVETTCTNNSDIIASSVVKPILKPSLMIKKSSDDTFYNVKDELEFTISVKQTVKNAIANNVIVKDTDFTEGVELDLDSIKVSGIADDLYRINRNQDGTFSIEITSLSYNSDVSIKVKGKVASNELAGTEIMNSASVTCDNNPKVITDKTVAEIYKPQLEISKTADKEIYNVNDNITYTLKVKQIVKNAIANDIILNDVLPLGVELNKDSFKVDGIDKDHYSIEKTDDGFVLKTDSLKDECTITYQVKITDNSLAGSTVINKADVTCSNNPDVIETEAESKIAKPVLSIIKESDKEKYNVNDTVHYTITLKQTDKDAIAYNVKLSDQIPNGVIFDESSLLLEGIDQKDYSVTSSKDNFIIIIKKLSYNVPVKVMFNAKITDPSLADQKISNTANALCDNNPEIVKGTNISSVYKPQLEISKTADKEIYNINDNITYTLKVKQTVKNAIANDIILNDVLPLGVELNEDSFKVDGIDKDHYSIEKTDDGFVLKTDSLEKECSITYQVKITDNSLAGSTVINKADVTCSNNQDVIKTEAESKIAKPVLSITKESDKEKYNVNDTVHYTVNIEQTDKDAIANNVVVKDFDLTDGVDIDMESITVKGIDEDNYKIIKENNEFQIEIMHLKYDEKVNIEFDALIHDNNLANQEISNTASVTSSNNPEIKKAEKTNEVLMPVFEIVKTSDQSYYNIGDIIHYTVKTRQTVENAKAYETLIDDSYLNSGVDIDHDSITVKGIKKDSYSIENREHGYIVKLNKAITSEDPEIIIEYDATVNDPALAGQKIEHEVYVSCANNPIVKSWKTSVQNEILKPDYEITKHVNKELCQSDDIVEYTIDIKQVVENAKTFHATVEDIANQNITIDIDSFKVSGINENKYSLSKSDKGFKIIIDDSEMKECSITYKAKITGEAKDEAINSVNISSDYTETKSSIAKTVIKAPLEIIVSNEIVLTEDAVQILIPVSILLISGLVIISSYRKKKKSK